MISRLLGILLLVVVFFSCCVVAADIIYLNTGGVVKGKIVEENDDELVIKSRGATLTIPHDDVDYIDRGDTPEEILAKQVKKLAPDDVAGRYELGVWLQNIGEEELASKQFESVLKLDPNHEDAHRALGHVRREGKWLTRAQTMRLDGYVKYKGKWHKKEDVEKLKAGYVKAGDEWVKKEELQKVKDGYRRYKGEWIPEEEYYKKKGLVKYEGKWVTPKEAESLRRKAQEAKKKKKRLSSKGRGGRAGRFSINIPVEGDQIRTVFSVPNTGGRPTPLLVWLHPDGAGEVGALKGYASRAGWIVVAPYCPNKSWWRYPHATKAVMKVVEEVKKAYNVDLRRIYMGGFSGGSTTTSFVGREFGNVFAACGMHCGVVTGRSVSERKAPFYVYTARNDHLYKQYGDGVKTLRSAGHEVKFKFGEGGHTPNPEAFKENWAFFQKHKLPLECLADVDQEKKKEPEKEGAKK